MLLVQEFEKRKSRYIKRRTGFFINKERSLNCFIYFFDYAVCCRDHIRFFSNER